jgi:hypothetical protein
VQETAISVVLLLWKDVLAKCSQCTLCAFCLPGFFILQSSDPHSLLLLLLLQQLGVHKIIPTADKVYVGCF